MKVPNFYVTRMWDVKQMRCMCLDNSLYADGSTVEYHRMLAFVDATEPTYENIYRIAADINAHSENQTVENIMHLIERHVVITEFEISHYDKIALERSAVCGDAGVYENQDILCIDSIGSCNDTATFFKNKHGGISVSCGCFRGTLEEFEVAVAGKHGNNRYAKEYQLAIQLAKLHIKGSETE